MKKIFFLVLLFGLWFFLFPIYRDRIPAFGCFDDCFNYMGGYFLNSGKHLYSEIFYNHQPIMAYISAFIQRFGNPQTIYTLVLQHRLFVIVWAIAWNIFLTLRFGWIGLGFAFLYEVTKGYVFGERFLAEALIVYPLVYLIGLKFKKIYTYEYFIIPIVTWFIVFSREPYIPLALLLFILLYKRVSLVIFLSLSIFTIFFHLPSDYFFNVVTVNGILASSANIIQSFTYPILIFFGGTWNLFRYIEVGLVILFWLGISKKHWVLPFIILGLANIRPVPPGTVYYEAFQHLVGYGVLIFIVLLNVKKFLWLGFILLTVFAIFHPRSYLYDRVDRNAEFTQNYGQYYVAGEVVRQLSDPSDTLFLDGLDDLIYWQAKRYSPYKYSWYTSIMHEFNVYKNASVDMFRENPPDFYYGKCSDDKIESILPDNILNDYLRFYWQERPTCLFVHKEMYKRISKEKLVRVDQQFDY